MIILGCDPGLTGAFAAVDTASERVLSCVDMPIYLQGRRSARFHKRAIDPEGVTDWLSGQKLCGAARLAIEEVQGLPGQSAPAAFNFGYGYGIVLSIARMLGFEICTSRPQQWKGFFGIQGGGPKGKQDSLVHARRLFPHDSGHWPRTSDHGRAEAALIALYGARNVWRDK